MTKRSAAVSCLDAVLSRGHSRVAVLGSASRTWYQDLDTIAEIVELLGSYDVTLQVAGKLPFDRYVEDCAAFCGVATECTGPTDLESRLRLVTREDYVLDGCCCVVAFPRDKEAPESADPLVEVAVLAGLPVLVVGRKDLTWLTPGNTVYT